MSCLNIGYYRSESDSIPAEEITLTSFNPRNKIWTVEEFLSAHEWVIEIYKNLYPITLHLEEYFYKSMQETYLISQELERLSDLISLYWFVVLLGQDGADQGVVVMTKTSSAPLN